MWELMGNAWRGWLEFTSNGKLCALFLASLVFLWVYYKRAEQKNVLIYGAMMTGFCIVPATAAVLMVYQTKFYDYQWIWSMVPMTLVTAEAAVVLLAKLAGLSRRRLEKGTARGIVPVGDSGAQRRNGDRIRKFRADLEARS